MKVRGHLAVSLVFLCIGLAVAGCPAPSSEKPIAAFTARPTSGVAPLTVQFTDQSTSGNAGITSWLWDFGDGGTSTEIDPTHIYVTPGTYDVSLAVTTAAGSDMEFQGGFVSVASAGEGEGEGEVEASVALTPHQDELLNTAAGTLSAALGNDLPTTEEVDRALKNATDLLLNDPEVASVVRMRNSRTLDVTFTSGAVFFLVYDVYGDFCEPAKNVQQETGAANGTGEDETIRKEMSLLKLLLRATKNDSESNPLAVLVAPWDTRNIGNGIFDFKSDLEAIGMSVEIFSQSQGDVITRDVLTSILEQTPRLLYIRTHGSPKHIMLNEESDGTSFSPKEEDKFLLEYAPCTATSISGKYVGVGPRFFSGSFLNNTIVYLSGCGTAGDDDHYRTFRELFTDTDQYRQLLNPCSFWGYEYEVPYWFGDALDTQILGRLIGGKTCAQAKEALFIPVGIESDLDGYNRWVWNDIGISTLVLEPVGSPVILLASRPEFSPAPRDYSSMQSVTVTCATEGATIRYTTNGVDPTESSKQYTDPVAISSTTTLKARAWKTDAAPSAVQAGTYTIDGALRITTEVLPHGMVGQPYSQSLSAAGGTPPYSWLKQSGSLPGGLTLSTGGLVSGTPTMPGTFTMTVQAKDHGNSTALKTLNIVIDTTVLQITTTSLPSGMSDVFYAQSLSATGGTMPYIWSKYSGSLPDGLTFSRGGVLSGMPTIAGTYNFTVHVTEFGGQVADKSLSVTIIPVLPAVSEFVINNDDLHTSSRTVTLNNTCTGAPTQYCASESETFTGASWRTYAVAPTFTLSSDNGPKAVYFKVRNAAGESEVMEDDIELNEIQPLEISTAVLPYGTIGQLYNYGLSATGGTKPYRWVRYSGSLPDGIGFSQSGALNGTPTVSGTFSITIHVIDDDDSVAARVFSLTIFNSGQHDGIVSVTSISPASWTLVGPAPAAGTFMVRLDNQVNPQARQMLVVGIRDANGNWVSGTGEPQIVLDTVPASFGQDYSGVAFQVATKTVASQQGWFVWVRDAFVTSRSAAIADFKNGAPKVNDSRNFKLGPVKVIPTSKME